MRSCKHCKKDFKGPSWKLTCSKECLANMRRNPVDGFRKCLWCPKQFPFRKSLKVRGIWTPHYGYVGSVNQKYCSKKCGLTYRNKTDDQKSKVSKALKGRPNTWSVKRFFSPEERQAKRLNNLGVKSHFWKGGVTLLSSLIREHTLYTQWRNFIYKRDDYTCQVCREKGGKLNVDHYPIAFSKILKDLNIKSVEQAEKCEALWDTDNGRTLCLPCHKNTSNYLRRT